MRRQREGDLEHSRAAAALGALTALAGALLVAGAGPLAGAPARGLGKKTVAEMVGDEETMALVRDLGVDHAQGFHIGRPAPLARWLVERRPAEPRHAVRQR